MLGRLRQPSLLAVALLAVSLVPQTAGSGRSMDAKSGNSPHGDAAIDNNNSSSSTAPASMAAAAGMGAAAFADFCTEQASPDVMDPLAAQADHGAIEAHADFLLECSRDARVSDPLLRRQLVTTACYVFLSVVDNPAKCLACTARALQLGARDSRLVTASYQIAMQLGRLEEALVAARIAQELTHDAPGSFLQALGAELITLRRLNRHDEAERVFADAKRRGLTNWPDPYMIPHDYDPSYPTDMFWDPSRFPQAKMLEDRAADIIAELQDNVVERPLARHASVSDRALIGQGEWTTLPLLGSDGYDAELCMRLPLLCALFFSFSDPSIETLARVRAVLRLGPHSWVRPHSGGTNRRLLLHMGLIIPASGCALRVANTSQHWVPGKTFVFNDAWEHEAWNNSSEPRFVLAASVPFPHMMTTLSSPDRAAGEQLEGNEEVEREGNIIWQRNDELDKLVSTIVAGLDSVRETGATAASEAAQDDNNAERLAVFLRELMAAPLTPPPLQRRAELLLGRLLLRRGHWEQAAILLGPLFHQLLAEETQTDPAMPPVEAFLLDVEDELQLAVDLAEALLRVHRADEALQALSWLMAIATLQGDSQAGDSPHGADGDGAGLERSCEEEGEEEDQEEEGEEEEEEGEEEEEDKLPHNDGKVLRRRQVYEKAADLWVEAGSTLGLSDHDIAMFSTHLGLVAKS